MSTRGKRGPGYHLAAIPKGELGNADKILEEVMELIDAEEQGCKVMAVVELADMVGAIAAYLARHHPSLTVDDLATMARITKRAFDNGHRGAPCSTTSPSSTTAK